MAYLDLQRGTFAAAETLLGSRSSRKVGHNTYMRRVDADTIAVRYHATDVYTMRRDGWAILRSGGWHTSTTSQRINALLPGPWGLSSSKGLRYGGRAITPYADGLAINTLSGAVGFAGPNGAPDVLLTAEEVTAIVDAANVREEARAVKRAERIAREHPEPRTFAADLPGLTVQPSWALSTPHRGYRAASECASCKAERASWDALRRAALAASHPRHPNIASYDRGGPLGRCASDCPRIGERMSEND